MPMRQFEVEPLFKTVAQATSAASDNPQAAYRSVSASLPAIARSIASHPVQPSALAAIQRSLLQLQRDCGNRCVQRMVGFARRENGALEASREVEDSIQSSRGGGQTLDSSVRGQMERSFGTDFSSVRVHHDTHADVLSRSLEARAFTTGSDIFFREGAYQPGTSSGRELLAHELTHVVQQTGRVQTKMSVSQPGDVYEVEADRMAQTVMRDELVQRQPEQSKEEDDEPKTQLSRYAESSGISRQTEDEQNEA